MIHKYFYSQGFIQDFLLGGGGGEHLGDLLKPSHIGGCHACLTEIMTSEINKVSANKLVVNKFQLSVKL